MRHINCVCVAGLLLACEVMVSAQGFVFRQYDVPNAADTFIQDVNDTGAIVGEYGDVSPDRQFNPGMRGFLKSGDSLISLSYPGSTQTSALGLNNLGDVVGEFVDSASMGHGFLFKNGIYTPINFPGAQATAVFDVNDNGLMVGSYLDVLGLVHGFTYSAGTGYLGPIDEGFLQTGFTGIANDGTQIGTTTDINELFQVDDVAGFVLPAHDIVKVPDNQVPGRTGVAGTFFEGISNAHEIVGRYVSVVGSGPNASSARVEFRGMRYDLSSHKLVDVEFPGGGCTFELVEGEAAIPALCNRSIQGVNSVGTIVGYSDSNDGVFHGFIGLLPIPADLNADGSVDAGDAAMMFGNWGGPGAGDLNVDSIVDAADAGEMFAAWTGDLGRSVPEPQLSYLVYACLACLTQLRRKEMDA